jgi:hypothetical protein
MRYPRRRYQSGRSIIETLLFRGWQFFGTAMHCTGAISYASVS